MRYKITILSLLICVLIIAINGCSNIPDITKTEKTSTINLSVENYKTTPAAIESLAQIDHNKKEIEDALRDMPSLIATCNALTNNNESYCNIIYNNESKEFCKTLTLYKKFKEKNNCNNLKKEDYEICTYAKNKDSKECSSYTNEVIKYMCQEKLKLPLQKEINKSVTDKIINKCFG